MYLIYYFCPIQFASFFKCGLKCFLISLLQKCTQSMETHLGAHAIFLLSMRTNGIQTVPKMVHSLSACGVQLSLTTVVTNCGATAQHVTVSVPCHLYSTVCSK